MNRLPLAQVTLCAVDCRTPALAASALLLARAHIAFGRVVLFTHGWLPTVVLPGMDLIDIGPQRDAAEEADFVVRRLHAYLGTSHALLTHWNAGVLHAQAWTDEFLVHDHVAAPTDWPTGQGLPGLTLRSRRLLRAGADPRLGEGLLDDLALCGRHRSFLESVHGVSFAPEALGHRFAATGDAVEPGHFGFSGAQHLPRLQDETEMLEVVRRLPPAFVAGPGLEKLRDALLAQAMAEAAESLTQRRASEQARAAALRAAGDATCAP